MLNKAIKISGITTLSYIALKQGSIPCVEAHTGRVICHQGEEFQVNNYTTNAQADPTLGTFANGNFIVTWHSDGQDGSNKGIYGQLYDRIATKIGREFQINNFTTGDQSFPSVSTFYNGNFVVTWHSNGQDDSSYGVFGQLFDGNGAKLGNEFLVNNYTSDEQSIPSVSVLPNNDFVVTWQSHVQDGSSYGIFGQRFDENGEKVSVEFQVNNFTSNTQSYTSVSGLSNNNFVVTWQGTGQDGSFFGIYGQLFNENGDKMDNEFQVNNFTSESQTEPSVRAFPDGNFVVMWHSDSQDGSSLGVYGRLFFIDCQPSLTISQKVLQVFRTNNIQKSSFPLVNVTIPVFARHYPVTLEFSLMGLEGQAELVFNNTRNLTVVSQNNTRLVVSTLYSALDDISSSISIHYHQTLQQISVFASIVQINMVSYHLTSMVPVNIPFSQAVSDTYDLFESTRSITGNVLTNDINPLNGSLSVLSINGTSINQPTFQKYCSIRMQENGDFLFTLKTSHSDIRALQIGQTLTIPFIYQIKDEFNFTSEALLLFKIKGENNPPIIYTISSEVHLSRGIKSQIRFYVIDYDDDDLLVEFFDFPSLQKRTPQSGFIWNDDQHVLHLFLNASRYRIRARVKDAHGAYGYTTFQITTHIPPATIHLQQNMSKAFSFDEFSIESEAQNISIILKLDPLINKFRLPMLIPDTLSVSYDLGTLDVFGEKVAVVNFVRQLHFTNAATTFGDNLVIETNLDILIDDGDNPPFTKSISLLFPKNHPPFQVKPFPLFNLSLNTPFIFSPLDFFLDPDNDTLLISNVSSNSVQSIGLNWNSQNISITVSNSETSFLYFFLSDGIWSERHNISFRADRLQTIAEFSDFSFIFFLVGGIGCAYIVCCCFCILLFCFVLAINVFCCHYHLKSNRLNQIVSFHSVEEDADESTF